MKEGDDLMAATRRNCRGRGRATQSRHHSKNRCMNLSGVIALSQNVLDNSYPVYPNGIEEII